MLAKLIAYFLGIVTGVVFMCVLFIGRETKNDKK